MVGGERELASKNERDLKIILNAELLGVELRKGTKTLVKHYTLLENFESQLFKNILTTEAKIRLKSLNIYGDRTLELKLIVRGVKNLRDIQESVSIVEKA